MKNKEFIKSLDFDSIVDLCSDNKELYKCLQTVSLIEEPGIYTSLSSLFNYPQDTSAIAYFCNHILEKYEIINEELKLIRNDSLNTDDIILTLSPPLQIDEIDSENFSFKK